MAAVSDRAESRNCAATLGSAVADSMARARTALESRSTSGLLALVGCTLEELALRAEVADKRYFPASYGGGKSCDDDVLAGVGTFYVTQAGKVMLDCIGGHYQMNWGYNHPKLTAALLDALKTGVVWDNHANTPSLPVKLLTERLVEWAGGAPMGLTRVLLGLCTGSVACEAAWKIALLRYLNDGPRASLGTPVMIVLNGNYHGTNVVTQAMREMWPGMVSGVETVTVEPNDSDGLRAAFTQHGARVAAFWAEPVMMNREAIAVEPGFLQLARQLCTEHDVLMIIDEIQTGFWYPRVFLFRELGIAPDIVVVGKGLTAGFHPLAGLVYREELDLLEQYDAISTNGNASLAAYMALCNLSLIEQDRERLAVVGERHLVSLRALAADFPELIERVNGRGLLTGLKFRDRDDALGFHKAAVERGLWLRVHAYHEGHRTVLMKLPLVVDELIIDFAIGVMRELLQTTPWRPA